MIESKSKLRKKAIRKVQKMKDQENKINWEYKKNKKKQWKMRKKQKNKIRNI
jgi:hypothetical protein